MDVATDVEGTEEVDVVGDGVEEVLGVAVCEGGDEDVEETAVLDGVVVVELGGPVVVVDDDEVVVVPATVVVVVVDDGDVDVVTLSVVVVAGYVGFGGLPPLATPQPTRAVRESAASPAATERATPPRRGSARAGPGWAASHGARPA